MLLRTESAERIDVLTVAGPVRRDDAEALVDAVERALDRHPEGVVLDLGGVESLAPHAVDRLRDLVGSRTSVCVCCGPAELMQALPEVVLHPTRDEALAAVDAGHAATAVHLVPIEHSVRGPAQARREVHACAERLGLEQESDDLLLVVSEMVTNAIRHGAPPVELELTADDEEVVVAVLDGSPKRPQPRDADHDAEGGRGMSLVDLLCDDHGVRESPPGKAVWASVRRRSRGTA